MLAELYAEQNRAVEMVNGIELIRRQLYDLRDVIGTKKNLKDLNKEVNRIDSLLLLTEGKLVQLKVTGAGQDEVRWPAMLISKIGYLASAVATADFRPADQHREVHNLLKTQLTAVETELDGLMKNEMAAFGRLLEQRGVKAIIISGS